MTFLPTTQLPDLDDADPVMPLAVREFITKIASHQKDADGLVFELATVGQSPSGQSPRIILGFEQLDPSDVAWMLEQGADMMVDTYCEGVSHWHWLAQSRELLTEVCDTLHEFAKDEAIFLLRQMPKKDA